ncbi:uncharacterized protein LOC128995160 [Macrosteles quadrilineatus]|uniref:uncharacterized protein LOC128995160 n=1 Tax=Macrosteles quadrilineatus TaxID=74068 RepID=UPI0023E2E296|nr:uncharacterized protein LOC128995160 [Macrosteles quadrilineatus]
MSRYKVSAVKERLSRLTEKYSKSLKQEDSENSTLNNSLTPKESGSSSEDVKNFQRHITTFNDPTISPKIDYNVSSYSLQEESIRETSNVHDVQQISSQKTNSSKVYSKVTKIDGENSVNKSVSSESIVLSDLSNQFERICFISSSSRDLSDVESEKNQSRSISTKISLQENSDDVEEFPESEKNSKTFHRSKKDSSSMSLAQVNDSEISSLEELVNSEPEVENIYDKPQMSMMDSKQRIHDNIGPNNIESSPMTNVYPTKTISPLSNKFSKVSSNLKSPLSSQIDKTSTAANTDSSIIQPEPTVNDTSNKSTSCDYSQNDLDEKRNSTSDIQYSFTKGLYIRKEKDHSPHRPIDCKNKSTNTDPVKIITINKSTKHQEKKHKYVKKSETNVDRRKSKRPQVDHDVSLEKLKNRILIKPCQLLTLDEIRNTQLKRQNNQDSHWLRNGLTQDYHCFSTSAQTLDMKQEDIITQLLKSQIQLTRHFIESHQHMYLQVYQAAQLLNENYIHY